MPIGLSRLLRSGDAAYLAAFNASSALNYLYLVVMGLLLGKSSYGLFAALFAVMYMGSALGNAVQVAAARAVASARAEHGDVTRGDVREATRPALYATALVGGLLAASAPLLVAWFDASGPEVAWCVVGAASTVAAPAVYGVLQGFQRFAQLGAAQLAMAASRMILGVLFVSLGWGVAGAVAGVALGYLPSALLAVVALRGRVEDRPRTAVKAPSAGSLAAFVVASVAIAVPTSLDVALVRTFLSAGEAGVYGAIAVLGRAVLFAPMALSFMLLPRAAALAAGQPEARRLLFRAVIQTFALAAGAAACLLVLVALGWSPVGNVSSELETAAWYLGAMTVFAMCVPVVYQQLATGNHRLIYGVLAPSIAAELVGLLLFHGSLLEVARVVFAVHLASLAGCLVWAASSLGLDLRGGAVRFVRRNGILKELRDVP